MHIEVSVMVQHEGSGHLSEPNRSGGVEGHAAELVLYALRSIVIIWAPKARNTGAELR